MFSIQPNKENSTVYANLINFFIFKKIKNQVSAFVPTPFTEVKNLLKQRAFQKDKNFILNFII